jgi:hypothetical protein
MQEELWAWIFQYQMKTPWSKATNVSRREANDLQSLYYMHNLFFTNTHSPDAPASCAAYAPATAGEFVLAA